MARNFVIRSEQKADWMEIDRVHQAAFGTDDTIPALVHDLRQQTGAFETVSIVARTDGFVGHVMLSHAWLDTPIQMVDFLVLSPLGVDTDWQMKGIGTKLITAALDAADACGAPLVFLEGDPRFYGPRGFDQAGPLGFRRPSVRIPEAAFQVARLSAYTPSMTGTFVYRDAHWRHGVGLYPKARTD